MLDRLRWYCENEECRVLVFEEAFPCKNIETQLKAVIEKYYKNKELRKCAQCGHVNGVPKLMDGKAVLTHD